MNEVYVQGFIDKCAALGVDAEELVKASQASPAAMSAASGKTNASAAKTPTIKKPKLVGGDADTAAQKSGIKFPYSAKEVGSMHNTY